MLLNKDAGKLAEIIEDDDVMSDEEIEDMMTLDTLNSVCTTLIMKTLEIS